MSADWLLPELRTEVERQLLDDARAYGLDVTGFVFDWSHICGEGHGTTWRGCDLENYSYIEVYNLHGELVLEGWLDFIHGGDDYPLYVFWLFLHVFIDGERFDIKQEPTIPRHLWDRLPMLSKWLCAKKGEYDARWHRDPLVVEWLASLRTPYSEAHIG